MEKVFVKIPLKPRRGLMFVTPDIVRGLQNQAMSFLAYIFATTVSKDYDKKQILRTKVIKQ